MTPSYIKECFTYNFWTGDCVWNKRPLSHFKDERAMVLWNGRYAGAIVGSKTKYGGGIYVSINKHTYKLHRMIYLYMRGELPPSIDHIDNNPFNNSFANMRPANQMQQCHNTRLRSSNTSGVKGVSLHSKVDKWQAKIRYNYKQYYLGLYDTKENAEAAVITAREKLHANFANHGRK